MKFATSTGLTLVVLRYIPKSRRKDGEPPFNECKIFEDTTNVDIKRNKVNLAVF